jgi:hypothetical protein
MTLLDPKTETLGLLAAEEAKLTEAQKPIAALVLAHEGTDAAVRDAEINYRVMLQHLLKTYETQAGTRYETPESGIRLYLENLQIKIDDAKSVRARAAADLEAARITVGKLLLSRDQIARRIPIEETAEEAA